MPAQAVPVFREIAADALPALTLPGEDEAHVWLIPVVSGTREELSATESERAERFHRPADADRFSTGRRALRRLLAAYLGIAAEEIRIGGKGLEKPFVAHPLTASCHFNLSHSGRIVLIAFGGRPVGIDLEFIDRNFDPRDLLPDHFSEEEIDAIHAVPDFPAAFYRLWTRKEAVVKALGTGLQQPLKEITVLRDEPSADHSFHVQSFDCGPDYAAALACNAAPARIVFYRAI